MAYTDQIRQLWEFHKDEKMTNEEFLSKFRKEDKLYPVITLVLYYEEKEWDGSVELYEMFPEKLSGKKEILKNYVANYRINLVDAGHLEHLENFRTDLQQIFGMLKCRGTRAELVHYINENADCFQNIDEETYNAVEEFLHSDWILKNGIELKESEEKVDMCKALEELYNDGKNEGKVEGVHEKFLHLVELKLAKGKSVEEIADALEETPEKIREFIAEIQK